MKTTFGLLAAASALALAACGPGTNPAPAPQPESAGSAGPAYCETVPSNPDDLENWNEICGANNRR